MGFTGIKSWLDSDNAADFVSELETAFARCRKRKTSWRTSVRRLVQAEMKEWDNEFNTPGWLNVALALEAEGVKDEFYSVPVFSELLTERQYDLLLGYFDREMPEWNRTFRPRLKQLRDMVVTLRRRVRQKVSR